MSMFSDSPPRSQLLVVNPQPLDNHSTASTQRPRSHDARWPYQVAQQVKFLHLQAEVECLLQQLKTLKQQRLAADSPQP